MLLDNLYMYLLNNINKLEEGYIGANHKNLSSSFLENFNIPIPKLEIQESITQKMNELSDKIKNIDNDIVFIDNLMKYIMQSTYQ